jgi:hypothetical protein
VSDFHDRPPTEQRQLVDRSSTLQDLFDSERRGQKPEFKADVSSELSQHTTEFEGAWRQNFGKLKDVLGSQLQSQEGQLTPQRRAQIEVMSQQLDDLNDMKPGERVSMFKAFKDNSTRLAEAQAASDRVQQAMKAGFMPAAEDCQRDVVRLVSSLNQKATVAVIASTEKVLAREDSPEVKAVLESSLDDARSIIAAPFIERARLGAFLLNDQKPYQAEKVLEEALNVPVAGDGWKLRSNRDLRQNVKEQTLQLHVQNNLAELFEQNIGKLDPSNHKRVDSAELTAAQGKGDETFVALTKFLTDNYTYLTRHHWPIVSKPGITSADIKDYVQERSKQMNDLKLP